MQEIGDIFGTWPSIGDMATDLRRKYDTVLAWRIRKRIPEDAWTDVIVAAAKRGRELTVGDILVCNAQIKKRGRAAHKVKRIRRAKRAEALAI